MATYVLVHGGWHGGWCWKYVRPLLQVAGHEVYTPTLTGLGERAHLGGPDVSLETHIQDVLAVQAYEDLHGVVLVGHSSGGLVIMGVADRAPETVAQLVYLDASVCHDGESDLDVHTPEQVAGLRRLVGEDGWSVRPPRLSQPFGITDPAEAAWLNSKLTPHPRRAFTDPVRISRPDAHAGARTYIGCIADPQRRASPSLSVERVRTEPGWSYRELPTGHDAMLTAPRELGELLLNLSK